MKTSLHGYYLPAMRPTAAANNPVSSKSPGRGMLHHPLEKREAPKTPHPGNYPATGPPKAWKILSDWTEVQCCMILPGQAKPWQMFLPFMYDTKINETSFY